MLHLLTAGYGTGLPNWDVRFRGEYWRVSGPSADVRIPVNCEHIPIKKEALTSPVEGLFSVAFRALTQLTEMIFALC